MNTQPEALRLAGLLETDGWPDAAAELRRLHEENQALRQALAQPKWVGFTNVERNNLAMGVIAQVQTVGANMTGITNAILFIEEKLQEKNA